jgi:hypothetical protein
MSHHAAPKAIEGNGSRKLLGLLVEFDDVHALVHACEALRDAGYTRWDAHTPFPVHGLNDAMGLKPSKLPYLALCGGIGGLGLALLMQWWMNARDYPYLISGKPIFSLPANIPIIFELTVLFAAFAVFFGMLFFNGLPRYHHAVFYSERISLVTDDRFFISVEVADPRFDEVQTQALLAGLGGVAIERLEAHHDA